MVDEAGLLSAKPKRGKGKYKAKCRQRSATTTSTTTTLIGRQAGKQRKGWMTQAMQQQQSGLGEPMGAIGKLRSSGDQAESRKLWGDRWRLG